MSDAWYLAADQYWVDPDEAEDYPLRQGDLIRSEYLNDELGWKGGLVVHPTCEIPKQTVTRLQVAEVSLLEELPDDFQRGIVTVGFQEKEGHRLVAAAHTFFLAPVPSDNQPAFANFRNLENVPKEHAGIDQRVATMSHDCRVSFIRRWLYFRFRVAISMEDVQAFEASRIGNDPYFSGPRPDWAPAPS